MTIHELEVIGLVTAIAALWDQLARLLRWPLRLLIVQRELEETAARLLMAYLHANARRFKFAGGLFRLDHVYVRPLECVAGVFAESLWQAGQCFWLRRRPIWYTYAFSEGMAAREIYYLRGTVNWDQLLIAAAAWQHQLMQERGGSRYHVVHHGQRPEEKSNQPPTATVCTGDEFELTNRHRGARVIGWERSDLGDPSPISLEIMSLTAEQRGLVADVDRFIRSRRRCEQATIPWRRGWLLKGRPGTGKTSIVRALAVEHDLPIHTFDLGAMDNTSLHWAWNALKHDAPAIGLIEDIDGVYGVEREDGTVDTRALVAEGPTFDCLLQCIGGISTCDGVMLFISSNRPDRVDVALRRGGRIDQEVEFLGMDLEGRRKMARRILGDDGEAAHAAEDPDLSQLSPADFQERLFRRALAEWFGDAA